MRKDDALFVGVHPLAGAATWTWEMIFKPDADGKPAQRIFHLQSVDRATGADIPNYWAYAKAFTLHDHMFESDASWSWPMHQYMVSEWAALCTSADPMSCTSNIGGSSPDPAGFYSWTPLTYLLDNAHVTWRYYLSQGTAPDCDDGEQDCPPVTQLTTARY